MAYGKAILACAAIILVFAMIGSSLGWRHGGGMIPQLILWSVVFATWKALAPRNKRKDNQNDRKE